MAPNDSPGPGLRDYVKHAFLYPWNLLFFLGGAALAAMSPHPDAFIPIIGGLELAYLTGLSSIPRFRTAIDAKVAAKARAARANAGVSGSSQQSLERILETLPAPALRRFLLLRQRCFEMRSIASGVRGQADTGPDSAESIRTPALDRLLYLFLRLLVSQNGLDRFLRSTSEQDLSTKLADVRTRLEAAKTAGDERVTNSLQDSVADAELRLENYRKAAKDAEFVAIELDRIETKIQALMEMGVSRQDPDYLSHQVTAAAESMQHTEAAVNELQHLTGLADQIEEPPAILESTIAGLVARDR
ncbi:MAG TPA: hypothetical protein VL308_11780 [Gemmatimonadaceae bacterium]|jgi:hypothetical protein|nr:hypothetical protein [Gemmatimonadaceae bacterium]